MLSNVSSALKAFESVEGACLKAFLSVAGGVKKPSLLMILWSFVEVCTVDMAVCDATSTSLKVNDCCGEKPDRN